MNFIKLSVISLLAISISLSQSWAAPGGVPGNPGNPGKGMGVGKGNQGIGKGAGVGKSNQGISKGASQYKKSITPQKSAIKFSKQDKSIINNFLKTNSFPAIGLPPGIAMNLARGKPLPPGIAKRFLPTSLLNQLPAYPGYEYLAVGNDIVLVNSTTGIIADILANTLR